jgi:hypothetical protein
MAGRSHRDPASRAPAAGPRPIVSSARNRTSPAPMARRQTRPFPASSAPEGERLHPSQPARKGSVVALVSSIHPTPACSARGELPPPLNRNARPARHAALAAWSIRPIPARSVRAEPAQLCRNLLARRALPVPLAALSIRLILASSARAGRALQLRNQPVRRAHPVPTAA